MTTGPPGAPAAAARPGRPVFDAVREQQGQGGLPTNSDRLKWTRANSPDARHETTEQMELPPAGPQAQGWTGKCRSGHGQCLAEVGMHPLAIGQDRPSRLDPAGEGRSDGGVLHLRPRGQARYPEGGRRREDEPPGRGWRARASTGRRRAPGRRAPGQPSPPGGSPPRDPAIYGLAAPSVLPPCCLRGTRQDLPCTSAGEPRTPRLSVQGACPRTAINSQRSPPAATCEPGS